jgi:hypothetical protein
MTRRLFIGALASGALCVVLAACGGAATPIPSASPAAVLPSQAASAAEPSAPASSGTEPSTAASGAGSSIALPSLPSEAKDLEAMLPDTMCGGASTKASVSGASLGNTAGAEFLAGLQALGKTPADVTFAFAFSTTGCGAGIFRIAGVDQGQLQTTMLAAVQQGGQSYTQATVGGKPVYVETAASGGGKQYVYFHGDSVIFASAPNETQAATILQALP